MNKLDKIKNNLSLLSNDQLDIIERLITSWQVTHSINLDGINTLENYSNEKVLDEYGLLFYNNSKNNLNGISINYNTEQDISSKNIEDLNSIDIAALISNKPNSQKSSSAPSKNTINDLRSDDITSIISTKKTSINDLNSADISSLISKKPSTVPKSSEVDVDDFDPLFPNEDFDAMTNLEDSKYKDLDFSALISKKN